MLFLAIENVYGNLNHNQVHSVRCTSNFGPSEAYLAIPLLKHDKMSVILYH